MSMIYYKPEPMVPSKDNTLAPGFRATPYGQEFGYYLGYDAQSARWMRLVRDARFAIVALAYDDDKDEFCTVLDCASYPR